MMGSAGYSARLARAVPGPGSAHPLDLPVDATSMSNDRMAPHAADLADPAEQVHRPRASDAGARPAGL